MFNTSASPGKDFASCSMVQLLGFSLTAMPQLGRVSILLPKLLKLSLPEDHTPLPSRVTKNFQCCGILNCGIGLFGPPPVRTRFYLSPQRQGTASSDPG